MAEHNDAPPASDHKESAREESDLDPAAFLKSVRELSERREREDMERYRKLEEEVQKGREARAARRAGELFFLATILLLSFLHPRRRRWKWACSHASRSPSGLPLLCLHHDFAATQHFHHLRKG